MNNLWKDIGFGFRMLLKRPGFTLIAVATLALGIGANTAIFSVINSVLLRPLPFPEAERLVNFYSATPDRNGAMSYPNFIDVQAASQSFDQLAVYRDTNFTLTGYGEAARLPAVVGSAGFFDVLQIKPMLGRTFRPEEDTPGSRVVVISEGFWRRRFEADPKIVGRNITLDNQSFAVIGVMPASFQFPMTADGFDVWTTLALDAEGDDPATSQRQANYLDGVARLKGGIGLQQAQTELAAIAANLQEQYPDMKRTFKAISVLDNMVGDVRLGLLILLGAVGCVLLIACANVASLQLARATARQREIAIRTALGASRGRIVRQLLTESALLAAVGGLAGGLLAMWATELLISFSPENLPRLNEIKLDGSVFAFTVLLSFATGILFGLAPALQASQPDLNQTLKEAARIGGDSGGRRRLRSLLVVAEVAIAIVLLVGAGLLIRTFRELQKVNPGFDAQNVLTFRLDLPSPKYNDPKITTFYHRLSEELQTLPGVRSVSAVSIMPFSGNQSVVGLNIEGRTFERGHLPRAHFRCVIPNYFQTLGIGLINGRDFTERDAANVSPVAIINESFARQHFPNEDPIGKHISPTISYTDDFPMREIVGVVADVRHMVLTEEGGAEIYLPHTQIPFSSMAMVIRTEHDPLGLTPAARAKVQELDAELPLYSVRELENYVSRSISQQRFNMFLLVAFAGVALLLTALGLYGVLAYSVAQRTHEIGVRLALGAHTGAVLRMVIGQGLKLTGIGIGLGLTGAFAVTRLMETLLFGVDATDPITFICVAGLLVAVALLACYVPARRATKVDPMIALRYE